MGGPGRLALVSYDLDGTLIDGTAFLLVARRLGFAEEVLHHDARFRSGEITLEECFRIEFALLAGRTLAEVDAALDDGTWFPGIEEATDMLHRAGLGTLVLTDNPDFIARHAQRRGVRSVVSSQGEVEDGVVTGNVTPRFDKWGALMDHLERAGVDPERVAHVGNDVNDVRVWENVGLAVCVEPTSAEVAEAADVVFGKIRDHRDIAAWILDWNEGRR